MCVWVAKRKVGGVGGVGGGGGGGNEWRERDTASPSATVHSIKPATQSLTALSNRGEREGNNKQPIPAETVIKSVTLLWQSHKSILKPQER